MQVYIGGAFRISSKLTPIQFFPIGKWERRDSGTQCPFKYQSQYSGQWCSLPTLLLTQH